MALTSTPQKSASMTSDDCERSESVAGRLELLLRTSHLSDCMFLVGGTGIDKARIFKAHKLILASSSPVFEAMCYGPLAEKGSINILDIDPSAFKIMLQHIYTDSVEFSSMTDACGTLYAAKKYMLTQLSQTCHDFIVNNLSTRNVVSVFEFLEELDESDLFQPCLSMIFKCAETLLANPSEHMKPSTLATIVKQDKLNVSEPALFTGIVQWAQEECLLRGLTQSNANCRSILLEADILCHIRFLIFPPKDFLSGPSRSEILSSAEINALWDAILTKKTPPGSNEHLNVPEGQQCYFTKKLEIPSGICQMTNGREHLSHAQYYCVRSFLKASKAICGGNLMLMTEITVSKCIFIKGVRFFSRLMPQPRLNFIHGHGHYYPGPPARHYKEQMEIRLCNKQNKLLAYTLFSDEVEFTTKVTALFKNPIFLHADEEYSIFLKSCSSSNEYNVEYPSAYLSNVETQHGIEFTFNDFRRQSSSNPYSQHFDMSFLDSIVYSYA